MDRFRTLFGNVQSGWNNMDKKKRISFFVILICGVAFIVIISLYTNKTNYSTLFTNLELSDAGTIVNDLETQKIKYKLENGGKDILIDENRVDEYRLQVAMNGMMPENSTGFEIFDDPGLMVTDEDRKIMYQRALTGELQRSIMSFDAINSAKVLLVMSEDSIFDAETKEASASVILDLKPQYKVDDTIIKGIVALVSGAVKDLPEKNIQVVDSKGELLSDNMGEEDENNPINVLDKYEGIRTNFEQKLEDNINELLGTAYGRNKVKVSLYADLDFDSEEKTTIKYSDPVEVSEQTSATGGNIGVDSQTGDLINGNAGNVITGSGGDSASYEHTVNNELSSETTNSVKAPGKVLKLTTTVVYDGNLLQEDTDQIRNIVAAATGYDANRGDIINVEGVAFDTSYEEELKKQLEEVKAQEEASKTIFEKYGDYLIFGILSILGILMIISLIRLLFGKRKLREDLAVQQLAIETPVGGNIDITDTPAEEVPDEKLEIKIDGKEKKVKDYAAENPDIAADLIKAWLKD